MLFFKRFQLDVTIDCTRKFYTHLQLFVRGHAAAAALYRTKGAADISVGLNEAGVTVLHCYRLFIQMFRQSLPCHHLLFHLVPKTILYLGHL